MIRKLVLLILVLSLSGCGTIWTRTIYVPEGAAVRLRQDVRNVKIWARDKDGEFVQGRETLPEGWFCKPMFE